MIDKDFNVWRMTNNIVVYINSLGFQPRSWYRTTYSFVMHDSLTVYSLNIDSVKVKNSVMNYPDNVFVFNEINMIAVPTWKPVGTSYVINMYSVLPDSSIKFLYQITEHQDRIMGIKSNTNTGYSHIITYDLKGSLGIYDALNNFNRLAF